MAQSRSYGPQLGPLLRNPHINHLKIEAHSSEPFLRRQGPILGAHRKSLGDGSPKTPGVGDQVRGRPGNSTLKALAKRMLSKRLRAGVYRWRPPCIHSYHSPNTYLRSPIHNRNPTSSDRLGGLTQVQNLGSVRTCGPRQQVG